MKHFSKESFNHSIKKKYANPKSIISAAEKRLLKLSDHIKLYKGVKNKVDYICSAFAVLKV